MAASSKLTPPPGEKDENEEELSKDQIVWDGLRDGLLKKIDENQLAMFQHLDLMNTLESDV